MAAEIARNEVQARCRDCERARAILEAERVERGARARPAAVTSPPEGSSEGQITPEGLPGDSPSLLSAPDGQPDNPKLISGIGPKTEGRLNGLGIYHCNQIAAFTSENVVWVDGYLKGKGRIQRGDWVPQASILAACGCTKFSVRRRRRTEDA